MTRLFWKNIWDSKGSSTSEDLLYLDGYGHLNKDFSSEDISQKILRTFEIEKNNTLLEVGCGAGFLAREMQDYDYIGVDYSQPIINKHQKLFPNHHVLVADSSNLPFDDGQFDYVFCFGLFQYLVDRNHAEKTLSEMKRVSKSAVLLGDLKEQKTRPEHFVYPKADLVKQRFNITSCFYSASDTGRYNAFLNIGEKNDME